MTRPSDVKIIAIENYNFGFIYNYLKIYMYISLMATTHCNEECPVCFNTIYPNHNYIEFEICNHRFHINCINDWKKKKK